MASAIKIAHNHPMALPPPARFEHELLRFLADNPNSAIRDAYEKFGKPKGMIRGTIVKTLDRLLKKGLVERSLVDGTYLYQAKQGADELDRTVVESFIKQRLGGRLKPLALFLADAEGLDPDELRELREALDKLERQ